MPRPPTSTTPPGSPRSSRALALWRGPAYADLADAAPVGVEASRLEELRLAAVERRALALLDLGRDGEAAAELQPHLLAHPLRERLRELLMRALHQAGRRADALRLYRDGRELLAGELGIEPGGALRELHAEILREEPPAVSVRPAQLPPDVFAFTGRQAELAVLDDLLESEGSARVAAISGVGGVGKTGLAVRWAHRVAHRFPDGQLYADLGGRDPGRCSNASSPRSVSCACPKGSTSEPPSTVAWPAAGACSCCSTTPPTRPRSGPCCPPRPAASRWSRDAAGSRGWSRGWGPDRCRWRCCRAGRPRRCSAVWRGSTPTRPSPWPSCATGCRWPCASRGRGW
ncbi:AfsR/SARP family transcriptional regulator [Nonomuraea recticatena]|uniref:AfsR/SARP family transcriptional regulator n=1 Tax=Nonomuraea recticatena TaxID=46178 RepID=UPI00360A6EA8